MHSTRLAKFSLRLNLAEIVSVIINVNNKIRMHVKVYRMYNVGYKLNYFIMIQSEISYPFLHKGGKYYKSRLNDNIK